MAGMSTLNPFETKTEESRFSPLTQIGGAMGFLDEWGETLTRSTGQMVADGGSLVGGSIVDLFKEDVLTKPEEAKKEEKKTQIGGKTELNFNKPKEEEKMNEKVRIIEFRKQFTQDEKELLAKEARKKAMAKQRENVIKTVGGISNLSYEDVMDEDGKMRLDIEVAFNKKNSEMAEADLKKQKQNQVKQATGKIDYFMQQNMAGERAGGQHVMSAVG